MSVNVTVNEERLQQAWWQAGLDERGAADLLLRRFTYGARPGELERVLDQGLANWLQDQLMAQLPEEALAPRLAEYDALALSDRELMQRYPSSSLVTAHARRFFPEVLPPRDEPILDFTVVNAKRDAFAVEQGFRSNEELRTQVFGQKVLHAAYSNNQLAEVLVDFWNNHFFTSAAGFDAQPWLLSYERSALRPHALGNFRTLLGNCALHPALNGFYNYNGLPMEVEREQTTLGAAIAALRGKMGEAALSALVATVDQEIESLDYERDLVLQREFWALQGPNLPFADALLRLMTLGPDSGIADADVMEAARVLTGWTTVSLGPTDAWFKDKLDKAYQLGFEQRGSFLFRADWHDAREKRLLGVNFPAGHGLDEGDRLLDLLAGHEHTARHVTRKLAIRFVDDEPSQALLEQLASTFADSQGNIASVMLAMTSHPDFWRAAAAREKAKNPLEYAISALRTVDADIADPLGVAYWVGSMGRPLYGYQEPSGYPDDSAYWLNGSSLASRVNYAQQLAANDLTGVQIAESAYAGRSPAQISLQLAGPDFQLR